MKIIEILTGKPKLGEKAEKIAGTIFIALVFAALAAYCGIMLEINIALSAVLFLLMGAVCIKFGLYRLPFASSVAIHLTCALIGVIYGMKTGDMISDEETALYRGVCETAGAVGCFGFAEISFGALSSAFGKEKNPELFVKTLFVSFPLFFTMYVFIPSETFFGNCEQLLFPYTAFIGHFALKTVICSVVTALLICSFDKRFVTVMTYLTAGLLFCVYAQYMFMNKMLPTAIGEKVDWGSMSSEFVVNGLIWAALLAVPFAAGALIKKLKLLKEGSEAAGVIRYAALFLGGMQLLTLGVLVIGNHASQVNTTVRRLSGEEQFIVSKNKNIITFILDQADQKFFDKAYEESPERFECLKDFTCYTNTAMVYDSTSLSIPQMLTAAQAYPQDSVTEWYKEICGAQPAAELYSRLRENNYRINIFANFTMDYQPFGDLFDNTNVLTRDDITISKSVLYGDIETIAAYRYAPVALKQFTEPVSFGDSAILIKNACIFENIPFMNSTELSFSELDCNYFIVQHLTGTHGNTGSFEAETMDCLDLLDKYFSELKRLGVYDSSEILVTADHGMHYAPDNMPILYVKHSGQTSGEITCCGAPVSHTDYAATCLEAAGLYRSGDEALFGRPISQIGEDEQRERTVFQRQEFEYVGKIDWKKLSDKNHVGALFGYRFTGTKEDLKRHEESDPPDIVIETDGY